MKLNNGKNIISTDDVFLSNTSEIGNNLAEVLKKHDDSISSLKGDVKWLYKYGGVGGSGSGSSTSKLKIQAVIYYTDIEGQERNQPLLGGENISIKKDTEFSVVVTITSLKSLNEYKYTLGNNSTIIKATDTNGKITILPTKNDLYTLIVNGETTVSLSFNIYVKYMDKSLLFYNENGYTVSGYFYKESIPRLEFILTNYQPDIYQDWDITGLTINNVNITNFNIETISNSTVLSKKLTFELNQHFKDSTPFGIYLFTINYTFNGNNYTETLEFIYKSRDEIFIYCYTKDDIIIYDEENSNPSYTNKRIISIYYKIFGKSGQGIDTTYPLYINEQSVGNILINLEKVYYVQNIVSENTKKGITFTVGDYSKTYYLYLSEPAPLEYFFTNTTSNTKYLYNGAVWCNTDNLYAGAETSSAIMEFPKFNLNTNGYVITSEQTFKLKKIAHTYNDSSADLIANLSLTDFISIPKQDSDTPGVDGIFAFDLHHEENNYDLPIITISNGSARLILYKNKLIYYKNDTATPVIEDKLFIPEDSFILLYFKYRYSTSIKSIVGTPVVVLLTDGVFETKPLKLEGFGSLSTNTEITYHSLGNWYFRHIGIATFNCIPNMIENYPENIKKYYYDFDPIIPVNYYLTYINSIESKNEFQTWMNGAKFDSSIYETLSELGKWINLYKDLEKFIHLPAAHIAKLTNLPIYKIVPNKLEGETNFNKFLENTTTSYGEDALDIPSTTGSFYKWDGNEFKEIIPGVIYNIDYQGSSTLLYGVKNFEISTSNKDMDSQGNPTRLYFTPDKEKFAIETSFNLKADMVDSSHSNNVIIGNFVNNYMKSPFGDNKKSCLTGYPCLLYMTNTATSTENDKNSGDEILLGIYNINLNRSSLVNLGYIKLPENIEYQAGNFEEVQYWVETVTNKVTNFSSGIRVAEVQDNSPLYDYSLYDRALLQKMFGDFFITEFNEGFKLEYSTAFEQIFKHVCSQVKSLFGNAFPVFEDSLPTINNINDNYYYYDNGNLVNIAIGKPLIPLSSITNNLLNYTSTLDTTDSLGLKSITRITNPNEQFHIVCFSNGIPVKDTSGNNLYYKTIEYPVDEANLYNHHFLLKNILQYYMVCMAFGMVDSVQKNLTIKCPNYSDDSSTWYLGFYDMDTAFGISNSGGSINFKAFSDFVTDTLIISDYMKPGTGGWFDSPSSYIFLLAKYKDIFDGVIEGNYPYLEWIRLRSVKDTQSSVEGDLQSADYFCKKYVDNYFGFIHPLIWNLNFLYKYFSMNASKNTVDNELSRFNGTMRHRRKYWLEKRINFLDPLFGIRYDRPIGNSNNTITGSQDNKELGDINQTMFPLFTKGINGFMKSVRLEGEPNGLVILQVSTNQKYIHIFNSEGIIDTQAISVTTSTESGLFGTKSIKSISDCGPFLNNPLEVNTITNNFITEVNILSGPTNNVLLQKSELKSVKNIYIKNALLKSTYEINWQENGINSTLDGIYVDNLELDTLTIKNVNCKKCIITNSDITNLDLNNCEFDELTISGITNYTFTNVTCKQDTLTINSGSSFVIKGGKITNLTVTSALRTLTLGSNENKSQVSTFTFNNTNRLTELNVNLSGCSNFLMGQIYNRSSGASGGNSLLTNTITLNISTSNLKFRFCGFSNIKGLLVNGPNQINLQFSGLRNNFNLETFTGNNIRIIGNYVFSWCEKLDPTTKINATIATTDIQGLFEANTNLTTLYVDTWLNKNKSKNLTNVSYLFSRCGSKITNSSTLNSNLYNFLLTNESVTNVTCMFYLTLYTTLTCAIAEKICGIPNSNFIGNVVGGNYNHYLQIEGSEDNSALKYFTNIHFEGMCVLKSTLLTTSVSPEESDVAPTMQNLFNDNLTSINYLCIYIEDDAHTLDFSGGLPEKLTTLKNFLLHCRNWNIINFSECFINNLKLATTGRNFTKLEASVVELNGSDYTSYAYGTSIIETNDGVPSGYLDLHGLLTEDNKVTYYSVINKLVGSSGGWWNFTFPKYISQNNLINLLTYLRDNRITNINWLFSNCVVTEVDNANLLRHQLYLFESLIGTFYNCVFIDKDNNIVYMDIDGCFKNELGDDAFLCTSLNSTFARTHLYKLINALGTKSACQDLSHAFRSCRWKYKDIYEINNENILVTQYFSEITPNGSIRLENPEFIPKINWGSYSDLDKLFQIIPEGFFDILTSNGLANYCFCEPSITNTNLYGYIPSNVQKNWKGRDLITNCWVTYLFVNKDDNKYYLLFPDWYIKTSIQNRLKTIIPVPPSNNEPDSVVYLFDTITLLDYDATSLPTLGNILNTSVTSHHWIELANIKAAYTNDKEFNSNLKVTSANPNVLPVGIGSGGLYKNKIPARLLVMLSLTSGALFYGKITSPYGLNKKDKYIVTEFLELYSEGHGGTPDTVFAVCPHLRDAVYKSYIDEALDNTNN